MGWALAAVFLANLAGLIVLYLLLRGRVAHPQAMDGQGGRSSRGARSAPRERQPPQPSQAPQPRQGPEASAEELREEIGRMIVELNQVTDRSVALLEDKAAGLGGLLAEADRKMGLLKREIERHEVGARVYDRLAARRGAATAAATAPVDGRQAAKPPQEKPDLGAEVLRLHRAGFAPQIIASRVGAPLGEVELIISLGALARPSE